MLSGVSRISFLCQSSLFSSALSGAWSHSPFPSLRFRGYATEAIDQKKVLVLFGPTGIGKTSVAIELAKELDGELVSCDSVQIYQGVSIGANIATEKELGGVKQHGVSFVPLGKRFSVAEYLETSHKLIEDILKRGKVPVVVGGSFFYLSWFLRNRSPSAPSDIEQRQAIRQEIEEDNDWETSFAKLKELDPVYAQKVETNDYKRLTRALEINRSRGKTMAEVEEESIGRPNPYNLCCVSLHPSSRVDLWKSLDLRCEKMIETGLLREVKELLEFDRKGTMVSLGSAIGYRETIEFLDWVDKELKQNGRSFNDRVLKQKFLEYLERFQCTTRQLVRKQTCWIRQTEQPFTVIEKRGVPESVSEILRAYRDSISRDGIRHSIENEDKKATRTYTSNITIFNNFPKISEILSSQIGLSLTKEWPYKKQQQQKFGHKLRNQHHQRTEPNNQQEKKGRNRLGESWENI